ncbi:PREDICTED: probable NAD(P)H dehydrogenase (quinone) FQR1-like 2 isoform X2 [Nelumbo nucifera]|uniref:NAD(P)H dehydrogenase (quinone) n=1 Tax=Nelumbo nucifera TaxID=4432 RepID=A0A1U7ZSB2_NELNU|nr:PREDICTED: probable NAD(P)H dehydrogenase (quinone) FQR1-like 2 isoform X2 [Nelumbo nucifera]
MGKGGGCVPSKKRLPLVSSGNPPQTAREAPLPTEDRSPTTDATVSVEDTASLPLHKLKIFIVFYSMYGHVEKLARRMKKGVDGIEGVEGVLFRVPETLPDEVLVQMKVTPKDVDVPVISAAELVMADGVLFGFPTRYGCMAAQMKAFFDSTEQLWKEQKLAGKPAGFFVSTGTQGGGQETTALGGPNLFNALLGWEASIIWDFLHSLLYVFGLASLTSLFTFFSVFFLVMKFLIIYVYTFFFYQYVCVYLYDNIN